MPELICKLLHIGKTTYYKYLREGYPIITFLLSFKKSELEELLESGKIQKLEKDDFLQKEVIQKNRLKYLKSFTDMNPYGCLRNSHNIFNEFYLSFLLRLGKLSSFYRDDFNYLLNRYILRWSIDHYQNRLDKKETEYKYIRSTSLSEYDDIYKHFVIFKEWDSYMLLFLKECFETDFEILYDEDDSEKYKEEAQDHIYKYKIFKILEPYDLLPAQKYSIRGNLGAIRSDKLDLYIQDTYNMKLKTDDIKKLLDLADEYKKSV